MQDETLRENDRRENTYLICVLLFFVNFLIESHYLNHPLFTQAFFVKTPFFIIFNKVYFLTTHLYSRQNIIITFFFINFRLTLKNVFSKKTNTTLIFSIFLFNIPKYIFFKENERDTHFQIFWFFLIVNKISSYFFLQRNKIENFSFCIFFLEFNYSNKNQFFWILNMSWNLLMQKNQRIFIIFFRIYFVLKIRILEHPFYY